MRLAIAAVLLLAGAAPQDDMVRKIVPDADKIKKLPKKISRESREKIEKALGEKLQEMELVPTLWECYSTVPTVSSMERTRCLVTIVTVRGPKGPIKLGVAAATVENTLHAVKILENGDDKALESKMFLGQFEGFEYTPNLWNAPDLLSGAIRKASDGKDEAAKEIDTLLRMNSIMRAVGPVWDRMMAKIEKRDRAAADEVAAMDKAFDDSIKLVAGAKFMMATQQEKFRQYAQGARSDLGEVKNLLGSAKFDDAMRKSGELDGARCARCHGAYRRKFREARLAQNLGNGYFSTKLEVVVPERNLEPAYQAVATGVRKAILLATEAK